VAVRDFPLGNTSLISLQDHLFGAGPKRMLALDGGGTLGIMEIAFLEKIEDLLRKRYGKPGLRLCDYFDLIGGTSTGAIIATALALGMSAAEVKALYFEVGPEAFRKPWRLPILQPRFSAKGLERILKNVLGEREMQSPDLKTGLAIICKRVDEGSPWVLTNNPRAPYWCDGELCADTGRGAHLGNRHYKLREVVRASTAAPFFFAPQRLQILSGEVQGLFVDGGVSPYNNPSLQLLMLAGISCYGLNWQVSKDDLLLISIGAGWARPRIRIGSWQSAAGLAVHALHGVIWDSHMSAMALLQWMSKTERRWPINSEIKTLEGELLNKAFGEGYELLSFQRFDVAFEPKWLKAELGEDITEAEITRINDFMNPAIMPEAYKLASKVAAVQVQGAQFPKEFNIAPVADPAI
jgi:hypothetical protein